MFAKVTDQDGSAVFNSNGDKLGRWNAIDLETGELTPGTGVWSDKLQHVKAVYNKWTAAGKPRDDGEGNGFVTWAWDTIGASPFDVAQYSHAAA